MLQKSSLKDTPELKSPPKPNEGFQSPTPLTVKKATTNTTPTVTGTTTTTTATETTTTTTATETSTTENNQDCYNVILEKLNNAKITIRLHSSDLDYQKDFYHTRPWFKSIKLGDKDIPYHPALERDNNPYYSLWRTYKDHIYRGMPWKRGTDGIPQDGGEFSQSRKKGAIQQSFGALNFNYENNCHGLIGGYNFGNISLVLNKDKIKDNCIYTITDKSKPFNKIEDLATELAKNSDIESISGKQIDQSSWTKKHIRETMTSGNWKDCEEKIEVQIFKDIEFGKDKDIEKIYCVGVDDIEYAQLLKMVGEAVIFNEDGKLMESDKVQRY